MSGLICYNQFGKEISPYDICPYCDDIYKRCPHMSTNFRELLLKQGFKSKKISRYELFYYEGK